MKYDFLNNEHKEFPAIVHVENTNICNIKCIHCPQSDPYKLVPDYKPETIDMDIFEKIVAEVAPHPCILRMTPDGETLLPKDFLEQVKLIYENNILCFAFNTNGLLLEGHVLDALLNPGKTMVAIEISLDALFSDSYNAIRVGSDYNRVMRNIFTLLYERDNRGLQNQLKVLVSIVNQPEISSNEQDTFVRFWEPLADKVIHRSYVDTKGIMPQKVVNEESVQNKEDRWPCLLPFSRLVVTYDGSVRFCPDDWRKETVIGNISKTSLTQLWKSDTMNNLRNSHLKLKYGHKTCLNCTDWKVIKWGHDYLVALNALFDNSFL